VDPAPAAAAAAAAAVFDPLTFEAASGLLQKLLCLMQPAHWWHHPEG